MKLKEILKLSGNIFPVFIRVQLFYYGNKILRIFILKKWEKNGKPLPPPTVVKQLCIEKYQQKYNCRVLVETGTFYGNMIIAQIKNFEKIYSIELSEYFYKKAKKLFKFYKKVKILKGDSSKVLKEIVSILNEKTVFWLDAHYSGGITAKGKMETPIMDELLIIFKNNKYNHIILIDDARCFNGENDYPEIDEIRMLVKNYSSNYKLFVENDIIHIIPEIEYDSNSKIK